MQHVDVHCWLDTSMLPSSLTAKQNHINHHYMTEPTASPSMPSLDPTDPGTLAPNRQLISHADQSRAHELSGRQRKKLESEKRRKDHKAKMKANKANGFVSPFLYCHLPYSMSSSFSYLLWDEFELALIRTLPTAVAETIP